MARVFVTGSSTGLGLATATVLVDHGHSVLVHARNRRRATELDGLVQRGADLVIGDLASRAESAGPAGLRGPSPDGGKRRRRFAHDRDAVGVGRLALAVAIDPRLEGSDCFVQCR
jgi:NAD(P)-dependent dehydrogenase (short-subunit alcohol dehydrogenase family)